MYRTGTSGDRAQLVLIGAISIAFILLGVVVVFNSTMFIDTIGGGAATDDLKNERLVESEVRQGVSGLIEETDSSTQLSTVEDDIAEWFESYQDMKGNQGPQLVTIDESGDWITFYDSSGAELSSGDSLSSADEVSITYTYVTDSTTVERTITITI